MKLILIIVSNEDANNVSNALLKEKYFVTKLATTGGLLMNGNTTLLIGTDNEKVEHVVSIVPSQLWAGPKRPRTSHATIPQASS